MKKISREKILKKTKKAGNKKNSGKNIREKRGKDGKREKNFTEKLLETPKRKGKNSWKERKRRRKKRNLQGKLLWEKKRKEKIVEKDEKSSLEKNQSPFSNLNSTGASAFSCQRSSNLCSDGASPGGRLLAAVVFIANMLSPRLMSVLATTIGTSSLPRFQK